MIKQTIDSDIKSAMLAGDKESVNALRTIKSVILDQEVKTGQREHGLADSEVITLLQKESKKRAETADLYKNAGDDARASKEWFEKEIIDKYLPEMMSEEEVGRIVDEVLADKNDVTMQQMGQIIGAVKSITGPNADGALIAKIVKEKLNS